MRARLLAMAGAVATLGCPSRAPAQAADWKAVDGAMGRAAVEQPGGVHRFNFPRSDLRVVVDGVTLKPAFALGGSIAMAELPANAMGLGDLILTGEDVTPVIIALRARGVEQTAVHHRVIRAGPHVDYGHVRARGDAARARLVLAKRPANGGGPAWRSHELRMRQFSFTAATNCWG